MANLNEVIERYTPGVVLGGPKKEIDLRGLRADLEAVHDRNIKVFWICVVMVLLLFLVMVAITILRFYSPVLVQVFQGAFGITASGLIYWMFRLWRMKSLTEILIAVALNGSDEALRQVLLITKNVLLQKVADAEKHKQ